MTNSNDTAALSLLANEAGYDPIEDRLRENIRATIEAVFEEELEAFLGRCRYDCQRRSNFPQKCRSKIPHFGGFGCQPLM